MTPDIVRDFVLNFLGIVWEALPFIILGALIAGILEEVLPQQALAKLLPNHFVPAVLIGGCLGLVFPMCECGIVVVMRRLLRKGLPLSCCVSYMLAGPIVNLIVLGSTAVAFAPHSTLDKQSLGVPMVALRATLGFTVAVLTGFVVHGLQSRSKPGALLKLAADAPKPALSLNVLDAPAAEPKKPLMTRLSNISGTALNDFVDITVFLIIGSAISALVRVDPNTVGQLEAISRDQPLLAIPLMMAMAFVMCLCSEADAFLASSFVGMGISARLAFLVFGPMLDIKLLLMYTRVFRWKLIGVIVSCVTLFTLLLCVVVHAGYNPAMPGTARPTEVNVPTPTGK